MALYRDKYLQMIFATTLMAVIGVSLITPAFPEIRQALDLTDRQIGFLITFFTVPGIFLSPVFGILSDRKGRKLVLVFSLFLFGLAGSLIALTTNFNLILFLRFVQGSAASGLSTLSITLIGDIYKGNERSQAMGYNGSVLSVGTAIYPSIGGALAIMGWYYPFYIFLLAIPLGIAVWKFFDYPFIPVSQPYAGYLKRIVKEMENPALLILLLAGVVSFILLYGSYLTYFTLFLNEKFGANSFVIGIILSFMSASTAILASMTGRLVKIVGKARLVFIGFALYAIGLLLIFSMKNLTWAVVAVVIYGIGHGANLPSLQTLVIDNASKESRGAIMAIYSSSLRIGQSIGPVAMALIYSFGGFETVFLFSSFLAFFIFVILFLSWNKHII
ncbi:MAG: MFS transporter [Candidatus Methanofastidiosia archaeon]